MDFFLDLKAAFCIFKVWSFISVRSLYLRSHATCILILDSGYFDNQSYKVLIPTAWIPLLDTDEFNGGMQVSHPVYMHQMLQCSCTDLKGGGSDLGNFKLIKFTKEKYQKTGFGPPPQTNTIFSLSLSIFPNRKHFWIRARCYLFNMQSLWNHTSSQCQGLQNLAMDIVKVVIIMYLFFIWIFFQKQQFCLL